MRCLACNVNLSDRESTRRSMATDEFLDLCDHCFSTVTDILPAYNIGEDEVDINGNEDQEG